ncbi:MAG TPA: thiolase family protein [Candidatus Omnitrophota bacterium]|nr:thiolase family protein [Candidatus Omnitrophota bacterium]
MRDVVIAGAVRTAQAKLGGALKDLTNQKLGEVVLRGLLERTGLSPEAVDEVIFGCVGQQSDAHNVARVIALMAGIPPHVPAFTVDRNCASGSQAIVSAAQMIETGAADLVIAGGVEVMSSAPFVNRDLRFGKRLRDSHMIDALWEGLRDPVSGMMMGETAEVLAQEFKVGRAEQDEFALSSHQKAVQAGKSGKFKDEIIPVTLPPRSKRDKMPPPFIEDEGPNPSLTLKELQGYPPAFKEQGTVTAGNACSISDGAAALIVTHREKAKDLGLPVLAIVRSWAFSGVEPRRMGIGPVPATEKALQKAKLNLKDIKLAEINEAFAAQYLAVERSLAIDRGIVNVNGGAIALGHPVGATGARIAVTLLHEMKRRGSSLGLAALCVGGGQGSALIFERR